MKRFALTAGTVCALFAALIVAELVSDVSPAGDMSEPRNAQTSLAGAEVVASNVEEAVRAIEARPLFNKSRKPVKSDTPVARASMTVSSFNRRLTGVVIEADKRAAIFSGEGGNNRGIVVPEGAQIEGWFVETVTPTNVTLRTAGQSQVLELIRNKAKTAASSAPAAAQNPLSLVPTFLREDALHFESALAAPQPPSHSPRP
jgi:hypothetical protein